MRCRSARVCRIRRASPRPGVNPSSRTDQQILMRDLKEAIGIALDLRAGRLYATDLGGTVYSARLDGTDQKVVLAGQGSLTGITVVDVQDPRGR